MISIYTQVVYWSWIVIGIVWFLGLFTVKKPATQTQLSGQVAANFLILTSFILLFSPTVQRLFGSRLAPVSPVVGMLGIAVVVVGAVVAIWARVSLGSNWAGTIMSVKENHEFIHTGPYVVVRHPIYTGLLMVMLGTAFTIGQFGAYIATVLCTIAFLIRIKKEENLMQIQFPSQYPKYKTTTKALIPFIW